MSFQYNRHALLRKGREEKMIKKMICQKKTICHLWSPPFRGETLYIEGDDCNVSFIFYYRGKRDLLQRQKRPTIEGDDCNVSFIFYYIVNNKLYFMSAVCP